MPFLDIEGHRVHYRRFGTKSKLPSLVFIHGIFANHITWVKQIDFFAKQTDLVVFDLPGHGKSDRPPIEYTPEFFAFVVKQLIETLDLHKPILVGHSLGGFIAQTAAMNYPELAEKLVLLCTGMFIEFRGQRLKVPPSVLPILKTRLMTQLLWRQFCKLLVKTTKKNVIPGYEGISLEARLAATCSGRAILNIMANLIPIDVSEPMQSNKLPKLFITGTNDIFYHQAPLYRKLPNTRVEIIDAGEHIAHLLNAEEINSWILEFIQE